LETSLPLLCHSLHFEKSADGKETQFRTGRKDFGGKDLLPRSNPGSKENCTPFMVVIAAFNVAFTLTPINTISDRNFSEPSSERNGSLIGYFVNAIFCGPG
jgi:hypothetical protein